MNVDVRDIDVPMLMRCQRLFEAATFLAGFARPWLQAGGGVQYAKDTRWTHRNYIGVDHHVSQTPVAFQRKLFLKIQDGFLFFFG